MSPPVPPRGEYRSMYTVILDSDDFRALSCEGQHMLLVLKIALPWSGIAVLSPANLLEKLSDKATLAYVHTTLAELESARWIKRHRNVVWLVNGLKYEPSISVKDVKHRRGVQRRVASLPSSPLVEEFKRYYAEWFVESAPNAASVPTPDGGDNGAKKGHDRPSDTPSKGLPAGPSKGHRRGPVQDTATATAPVTQDRTTTELTIGERGELSTIPAPPPFFSTGDSWRHRTAQQVTESALRRANKGTNPRHIP